MNYSWNSKYFFIFKTILNNACLSGNENLVKYIIELDKIDINAKDIFFLIFMLFQKKKYLMIF